MLRRVLSWLIAVVVSFVLGSVAMTQVVLSDLASMGVATGMRLRLQTTLGDIVGLSGAYLPLLAVSLLIAFVIAGALFRLVERGRTALYLAAGAAGVGTLLWVLEWVLGLNPLSGARGVSGFLLQVFAGLAGGYVFARFSAATPVVRKASDGPASRPVALSPAATTTAFAERKSLN